LSDILLILSYAKSTFGMNLEIIIDENSEMDLIVFIDLKNIKTPITEGYSLFQLDKKNKIRIPFQINGKQMIWIIGDLLQLVRENMRL
jgi:hypothetical protein